ncbi:L,D-transpeptidase [Caldalkalibacillus mannanilyticus]|uniref:L,D-transpeptidase n=1 Tax=Caldalkalibacillus mannanilyticus TaxID=1418 RepID=UPI00046A9DC1|nr:L,D-transpeptidase [Caldalkalibacillus mannanilyticus]
MSPFIRLFVQVLLITSLTLFLPSIPGSATAHSEELENLDYEGVYLLINKATNELSVYLNGYRVYHFPIASGKNKELTPEGRFTIVNKVTNPWYIPKDIPGGAAENPLGSRWMGLDVPHTNGYKYGIHGTNDPSSIGLYVSQGCIRMNNKDIEWLHRHIPLHTPVYIINNPQVK